MINMQCEDSHRLLQDSEDIFEIPSEELYYCPFCYSIFDNNTELESHQCEEGDSHESKVPPNSSGLSTEKQDEATTETPCLICGERYDNIDSHMRSHESKPKVFCHFCYSGFKNDNLLNKHLADIHDVEPPVAPDRPNKIKIKTGGKISNAKGKNFCALCNSFYDSTLTHHNSTVHGTEKPYLCDICGRTFATRNAFLTHSRIHKAEPSHEGVYLCQHCGKEYATATALRKHENRHNREKSFVCELCGKAFLVKKSLVAHRKSHLREKRYPCRSCEKAFSNKKFLKKHEKFHITVYRGRPPKVPTDEQAHCCSYCGRIFKKFHMLRIHERVHTGEKPYKCTVCEKAFYKSELLAMHSRIHSDVKSFKCRLCEKAFKQRGSRRMHEMIHSGKRRYACRFCEKRFYLRSTMAAHERTHTGEKPNKCQYCERSFNHKGAVKVHERIHTGEKPYPCGICGRFFRKQSNCKTHEKTHKREKGESYSCSFCSKTFASQLMLDEHLLNDCSGI